MLKKGKIDNSLNIEENLFLGKGNKFKLVDVVVIEGYTGSNATANTVFEWEDIPEDLGGGKILKCKFHLSDTKDKEEWKKFKITIEKIK